MKVLHFGRGAVGKSYAAAGAVTTRGGMVFDTDGNWRILAEDFGLSFATTEDIKALNLKGKIVYVPQNNPEATVFPLLRSMAVQYKKTGEPVVPLIVFDGYSEFGTRQSARIAREKQEDWDASRTKEGTRPDGKVLDMRGWGLLRSDFIHLTSLLQPEETGAHLYATARVREKPDPFKEGGVLFRPFVDGSFGDEIESYFEITFPTFRRADGDTNVRRTFFAPEHKSFGSARFAVENRIEHRATLPEYTDEFSLEWLIQQLEEN